MIESKWTVQAYIPGRGWEIVAHADHRTEAEQQAQRLRLRRQRRVRIVRTATVMHVGSVA